MEELNEENKIDFDKLLKLVLEMKMNELFSEPYDPPEETHW